MNISVKHKNEKVYFLSDPHFFHKKEFIWQKRGFASIQEHVKVILDKINNEVGENDVLYILGDFALNSTLEDVETLFSFIKCKNIFYIFGNHESSVRKLYKKHVDAWTKENTISENISFEIYPFKVRNVTFLGNSANILIDDQLVILNHFAAYMWEDMQHGAFQIHGHSHGGDPLSNPNSLEFGKLGKTIDIGVDVCLNRYGTATYPFAKIKEILDKTPIVIKDHHDSKTT